MITPEIEVQSPRFQTTFRNPGIDPVRTAIHCALIAMGAVGIPAFHATAAGSDAARAELRGYVENVTSATGRHYGVHDNAGHSMDCAKIIANPNVSGQYLAVYHTAFNGVNKVNLATSTDLVNWTWVRELAGSGNGPASQPTIKASGSGFGMAWEQENVGGGNNHVKLAYFNSWTDLQNGTAAKTYDAARSFSTCAEGTPNFYSVSSTAADVGFHYFSNCDVDREARASANWTSWSASKQPNLDNAVLYWGVQGNIGDRDGMSNFKGFNYGMIEGQFTKGDFGSWRCFLYDYQTGNSDQLSIHTDGGSLAFGNPSIELVQVSGTTWRVIVGLFLFSEGIRGTDSAGELVYYKDYDNSGVGFYQNSNYGGAATSLIPKGNYTLAQLQSYGFVNDWASSMRVPSGWTVIIYKDDNFSGTSWTLTSDTPNFTSFAGLNDQASSCKIQ